MKVYKQTSLFLQLLRLSNSRERKLLLGVAPYGFLRLLTEVLFNLLRGNLPLASRQLQPLRRYKQTVRQLGQRSLGLDQKRLLLQQYAGSALLPHLLSILSLAEK